MLFFKDLRDEFLGEPGFRAFYEQECHICAATMALSARVIEMGDQGMAVLDRLGISHEAFRELVEGDYCNPETVAGLARVLGMETPGMFENCPRATDEKKGGRGNGRK